MLVIIIIIIVVVLGSAYLFFRRKKIPPKLPDSTAAIIYISDGGSAIVKGKIIKFTPKSTPTEYIYAIEFLNEVKTNFMFIAEEYDSHKTIIKYAPAWKYDVIYFRKKKASIRDGYKRRQIIIKYADKDEYKYYINGNFSIVDDDADNFQSSLDGNNDAKITVGTHLYPVTNPPSLIKHALNIKFNHNYKHLKCMFYIFKDVKYMTLQNYIEINSCAIFDPEPRYDEDKKIAFVIGIPAGTKIYYFAYIDCELMSGHEHTIAYGTGGINKKYYYKYFDY